MILLTEYHASFIRLWRVILLRSDIRLMPSDIRSDIRLMPSDIRYAS